MFLYRLVLRHPFPVRGGGGRNSYPVQNDRDALGRLAIGIQIKRLERETHLHLFSHILTASKRGMTSFSSQLVAFTNVDAEV